MVDLHTHILPHLDDGAFDLETSVRMADLAARSGVFHMAATSHGNYYDYTLEEYRENFERLQTELRDREIPVEALFRLWRFLWMRRLQICWIWGSF